MSARRPHLLLPIAGQGNFAAFRGYDRFKQRIGPPGSNGPMTLASEGESPIRR
jgi:hypothetical protein